MVAKTKVEWVVVADEGKGGLSVTLGKSLTSAQLPELLATGSKVEQLEVEEQRLKFRLTSGKGPKRGWVSITNNGTELCRPTSDVQDDIQAEIATIKEETVSETMHPTVQVFDMRAGVVDKSFEELDNARKKAEVEAEQKRLSIEWQGMEAAEQEGQMMRQIENEKAKAAAAEEEAAQRRKLELEQINERLQAEKEAADREEAFRLEKLASGDVHVVVYVNRMLRIQVDFWLCQGASVKQAKEALSVELPKKYSSMNLDPLTIQLQLCGEETPMSDCDVLQGEEVELTILR